MDRHQRAACDHPMALARTRVEARPDPARGRARSPRGTRAALQNKRSWLTGVEQETTIHPRTWSDTTMPTTSTPVPRSVLREANRIVEAEPAIEAIVLFGSRARDEHHRGSDIDLAVVSTSPRGEVWEACRSLTVRAPRQRGNSTRRTPRQAPPPAAGRG